MNIFWILKIQISIHLIVLGLDHFLGYWKSKI